MLPCKILKQPNGKKILIVSIDNNIRVGGIIRIRTEQRGYKITKQISRTEFEIEAAQDPIVENLMNILGMR
jgi:hypothetical protein